MGMPVFQSMSSAYGRFQCNLLAFCQLPRFSGDTSVLDPARYSDDFIQELVQFRLYLRCFHMRRIPAPRGRLALPSFS